MQLPYTVINVWRAITVWRGHSCVGAIHMWRGHYRAATAHGNWWLVRATYVVDRLFFGHFFGRWWGLCAYTVILKFWWLVRATYVVDRLFFGHFFWKVVGTVCIHGNT